MTSVCRTTTTSVNGGDNNNEHWTLMAQSRLGAEGEEFIGDRAGDLGAWNKLQLGWLDYETLVAGAGVGRQQDAQRSVPQEYNTGSRRRGRRAAEEGGRHRTRCTGRRRRSSGTAAPATTSRTRCLVR